MLVSNENILSILLPNNNKVLNDVLKEADLNKLNESNQDKQFRNYAINNLKELFTSLNNGTKSNINIENILKNSNVFKELGNINLNLLSLTNNIVGNETLEKYEELLKNFSKNIKDINFNNLKEQIKNSGIFLEAKLTNNTSVKIEYVLNQIKNITSNINNTQSEEVNEIINKILKNIKNTTNNNISNEIKLLNDSLYKLSESIIPKQTQNILNLTKQLNSIINFSTLIESKVENNTNCLNEKMQENNENLKKDINNQTRELLNNIKNDIIKNSNIIQNNNLLTEIEKLLKVDSFFKENKILNKTENNNNSTSFISNFSTNLNPLLKMLEGNLQLLNSKNIETQLKILKNVNKLENIIKEMNNNNLNTVFEKNLNEDIKNILLQMQDDVAKQNDSKSNEITKQIDKILTQIETQQLLSIVSNSNYVYIPFLWELLEDGTIQTKQQEEDKFFCQINLTLKEFGKIDLLLSIYDKNKIDITIYAQKNYFKKIVKENIKDLKVSLNNSDLIPVNIKLLDMKEENKENTQSYERKLEELSSNIVIRA